MEIIAAIMVLSPGFCIFLVPIFIISTVKYFKYKRKNDSENASIYRIYLTIEIFAFLICFIFSLFLFHGLDDLGRLGMVKYLEFKV